MKQRIIAVLCAAPLLAGWTVENTRTGTPTVVSIHPVVLDDYYAPPLQCDYEPVRPYVVRAAPSGFCGAGSPACSKPLAKGCVIWLTPDYPGLYPQLLRHEKGHCNCPGWVD